MATRSHDATIAALRERARSLDPRDIADDFLVRLASADSGALAAFAYATNLPAHPFQPGAGGESYFCRVCGLQREADVDDDCGPASCALRDLDAFGASARRRPTPDDIARFDRLLEAIRALPAEARATDLERACRGLFPRSSADARRTILSALGTASVLSTMDQPGHFTRWVGFWEMSEAPALRGDLNPPLSFWRGEDGVHRAALDALFPHDGIARERFAERRQEHRVIESVAVALRARKRAKKGALVVEPGDVLAMEHAGAWIACVVLGARREGEELWPVVEMLEGTFGARPEAGEVLACPARVVGPFRVAPTWRREPIATAGLGLFGPIWPERLERVGRGATVRVADGVGAAENVYRVVLDRNLLYMLKASQVVLR